MNMEFGDSEQLRVSELPSVPDSLEKEFRQNERSFVAFDFFCSDCDSLGFFSNVGSSRRSVAELSNCRSSEIAGRVSESRSANAEDG